MIYALFDFLERYYDVPGAGLFQFISFRAMLAGVLALITSTFFGKYIIALLRKQSIGETIRDLNLKGEESKRGTPTMGGVMIIGFTLITVFLMNDLTNIYIWLLVGTMVCMGSLGFVDDYIKVIKKDKKGISSKTKMIVQSLLGIVVGVVLYFHQDVKAISVHEMDTTQVEVLPRELKTTIPFFKHNEFDYGDLLTNSLKDYAWVLYTIIVIFVIMAVSNGANLTDGLDGLAGGTSVIIVVTLGILAWISGNILVAKYLNILYIPNVGEVLIFLSAFAGALIGFLWYNQYPAQVFMGDTGSLTIGAVIAVTAFMIRKELLLPLLGGIFVLENLSVLIQLGYFKYTKKKTGEGKRVFLMAPLHHHYQKKGYHEAKVTARFIIVGVVFAILTIATLKVR